MKRFLALFSSFLMLICLVSCVAEPSETKTETLENIKKTEEKKESKTEEKEELLYPTVENPLTWADLDAIPIAKSTMSIDQVRQICVDYFNLGMTFRYVPNASADYIVTLFDLNRTMNEGTLYGGMPYVNSSTGNLYRVMEFYDSETGILDMTLFKNQMTLFGNDCYRGSCWAWARAINSARFVGLTGMTHANGFLILGSYKYDTSITEFEKGASYGRKNVCLENGEQVMFESYALLQKADGTVNSGHVRMATENAVVVRNADNTINGEESYVIVSDQICFNDKNPEKYERVQSDGTKYLNAGGCNWKVTFAEMYKDGYLPFTFAEFLGTDPVEDGQAVVDYTANTITPAALQTVVLSTNYIMSDIRFIVRDAEGKELLNFAKRITKIQTFSDHLSTSASFFDKYAQSGTCTIEVKVQIGNGENLTAYAGTLVKG